MVLPNRENVTNMLNRVEPERSEMMDRFQLLALAGLIATTTGCVHTVSVPPPERCPVRTTVPASSRDSVHIFLINGLDPIDAGGLTTLREYLDGIGFGQTYYAQLYHRGWCQRQIDDVRKKNPEARIVLVGYDAGAEIAADLARDLTRAGRPADLLMLVGARDLTGSLKPDDQPLALQTINVRGQNVLIKPPSLPNAVNIDVEGSNPLTLATHPATLDLIGRQLLDLASMVPIVIEDYGPAPLLVEPVPVPRPEAKPPTERVPPEWQFLQPRPILGIQSSVTIHDE